MEVNGSAGLIGIGDVIHLNPFKGRRESSTSVCVCRRSLASKAEVSKDIAVFNSKQKLDLSGKSITVEKVSFTPINTSIVVTGKYSSVHEDEPAFFHNRWFVFEHKGEQLEFASGRTTGIRRFLPGLLLGAGG